MIDFSTGGGTLRLFHTGYHELRQPDIRRGRKNADFGQGFYLSDSDAFAGKWARERRGEQVYVNAYELELQGLRVLRLERDEDWFDYIFANRAGRPDAYPEADVILGPTKPCGMCHYRTCGAYALKLGSTCCRNSCIW